MNEWILLKPMSQDWVLSEETGLDCGPVADFLDEYNKLFAYITT
jgi:hypothetical protein